MRIAMISEHASPLAVLGGEDAGGQNTHVAELSAALAAAGHEVRVYTRRDAPDLPVTVRSPDGYDVVHVPAGPAEPVAKDALLPHMREFSRWLTERWRGGEWVPEVIHAHFWMSGLAALTAGRQTGVPVVQTYHALGTVKRRYQGVQDTSPARRVSYERELGRSVDRIVAQCRDEVGELVRMGVPRSRMTVVPSGVNLATFAPLGPAADREPGRARILTVGRLVERKGFQTVIRAMALVADAECVVVGGPPEGLLETDPYARRLRALAESCGVADRVHLVGAVPREEMGRWYRSADLLVAAPWYEPFGLTPLEAMACGVPVVGTAVGGIRDTVVDGTTGDLVPARDPHALAGAIQGLLDDRIRRFAYATAARERARTRYSWAATAERLVEVYSEVAAVRRPTRVVA
ncbi:MULTISPECIES: glycosyltransferase [Micromonospora]|uniref:Glycosyltransferase involved in cell wall bisynthesis n=1 Tax=Micromonospora chokoriensis TaxID=356851 RepID=A0A1C4YX20_9ACTN|nr:MULTISPECIES: glycosyltransferase [Micromonospora]MCZ7375559.1 glycosyltransferase [Micromonospora sp. WMMC250]MDG4838009.1 glycosyltransferase [Micromonospora sp. WMMD967]SCF25312.1 Glycosyltransferase involved in cell wall bisynthesis [Micromonospora chokoriensis]